MLHQGLTQEHWNSFPFVDQMANVSAEVGRYYKWKAKSKLDLAEACLFRALELLDLTKADSKNHSKLSELCRIKELWLDLEWGNNQYHQNQTMWLKYMSAFEVAASRRMGK
jgi:hypothetical protein